MADTVDTRLAGIHPKMLRAEGESERKKLVGRRVERALELCGMTKQEAAYAMGYSDAGAISRWCAGTERPQFDKLNSLGGFEEAHLIAVAERNPAVTLRTVIEIRRTA